MKLSFIHIPKTAGTYLHHTVLMPNEKRINNIGHAYCYPVKVVGWKSWDKNHRDYNSLSNSQEFNTFDYNKDNLYFSIVRNPFDLLHSYYHYQGKDGSSGWGNCRMIHNLNSFAEFVDHYLSDEEWHLSPMKSSLYSMAKNKDNKIIIDDFIKFNSDPQRLFVRVVNFCEKYKLKINENFATLKSNESKVSKPDYRSSYRPDQVDKLKILWKQDLQYFNYDFE